MFYKIGSSIDICQYFIRAIIGYELLTDFCIGLLLVKSVPISINHPVFVTIQVEQSIPTVQFENYSKLRIDYSNFLSK